MDNPLQKEIPGVSLDARSSLGIVMFGHIVRRLFTMGFASLLVIAALPSPIARAQTSPDKPKTEALTESKPQTDAPMAIIAVEGFYASGKFGTWLHGGGGALTGSIRMAIARRWVYVSLDGLIEYVRIGDVFANYRIGVGGGLAFFSGNPVQLVLLGHLGMAFLGRGKEGVVFGIPLDINVGLDFRLFHHLMLGMRGGWVFMPDLDKTRNWLRVAFVIGYCF